MHGNTSSTRGAFAAIVARGGSAVEIARTARAVWQHIDASLSPIIGRKGVAALYRRSVHLLRHDLPALDALDLDVPADSDFAELQRASACLTSEGAGEMNAAVLETFRELLTKLIGASLCERLLRPAWDHLASNAGQEPSP